MDSVTPLDVEKLASIIEAVKIMPLRPDDIIVVKLIEMEPEAICKQIEEMLRPVFGDRKILVIDGGIDLEIMRPAAVA